MPFDVFRLRDHVVREYRDYVESFVHVLDPRIDAFVRERLAEGELWPASVLQLNPAYEPGPTLGELAQSGAITADTARFFGPQLQLHRHQAEALAAARRGDNYIVSRIASPEMLSDTELLPHLICSPPMVGGGGTDEAGQHGDTR